MSIRIKLSNNALVSLARHALLQKMSHQQYTVEKYSYDFDVEIFLNEAQILLKEDIECIPYI